MLVSARGCAAGQSEGSGGLLVSNEKLRSPSSMHLLVLTDCRGHLTQTQRQRGEGDAREMLPRQQKTGCTQLPFFKNIFLLFSPISTHTKEKSGCWGSEAGTRDAARQSLIVPSQSLSCLHPSVARVLHRRHRGGG